MNELTSDIADYFFTMAKRPISKWSNYFPIYEAHFDRYRGVAVNVLEIGIGGGGSLQMWKWYFGSKSQIFGIDIDPDKLFQEKGIKTFECDQNNGNDLTTLMETLPKIDIVIDDGNHLMEGQITTFETVYPFIAENGIYLCEDTHTSFFPKHGGGPNVKRTYMAVMKKYIDQLSAFHSRGQVKVTNFTKTADSMHFYNSIVVIEKGKQTDPKKVAARVRNE